MTKKGYQKRLPKVLPDAGPRPVVPAPRVPAPRASAEGTAEGTAVVAPEAEPIEPDEHHARASADRHRWSTGWIVAVVLGGSALCGIAAFLLVGGLLHSESDRPAGGTNASSPTEPDSSSVVSTVLPNGDVVVRQRIRAIRPIRLLRLELPPAAGGEGVSATQVEVVADGNTAFGRSTITDASATYIFAPATDVRIRYRLTGVVQLSESAPGRALAVATTLGVRYAPRVARETRVVHAAEVLMLACGRSPDEPPVPCGEPDGDGRWRVELTGQRVDDRVVAQLTLG